MDERSTAVQAASVEEVADGVFAYVQPDGTWWINNAGFLLTDRGVISVDACATEARTRAYLAAIAEVTDAPVRTLLNTHHHGDHTFGNYLFTDATIVGHEGVRDGIAAWGQPWDQPVWTPVDWGEVHLAPPFLTFTDEVTLWLGDQPARFRHTGTPAHTTNDSYLWLPGQRVLFCGDLAFNGGTPFVVQGSVTGAIDTITQQLQPLGAERIVCGHGPVAGPDVLDRTLAYLHFVQQLAEQGRAAGVTPLEAARDTDLGEFGELTDAERLVGNLHRAYAELDGLPRGAPLPDLPTVLADMLAFNGGPLRSHA